MPGRNHRFNGIREALGNFARGEESGRNAKLTEQSEQAGCAGLDAANELGVLGRITDALSRAEVNIEYAYFATSGTSPKGIIVIRPARTVAEKP